MTQDELQTHRYRENTMIQPTFFMPRHVFERAGPFEEGGRTSLLYFLAVCILELRNDMNSSFFFYSPPASAAAEDLKFFYRHIDEGGELFRVDEV